jgi:hypothetical protein
MVNVFGRRRGRSLVYEARPEADEIAAAGIATITLRTQGVHDASPERWAEVFFRPNEQLGPQASRTLSGGQLRKQPNAHPKPRTAVEAAKRIGTHEHLPYLAE